MIDNKNILIDLLIRVANKRDTLREERNKLQQESIRLRTKLYNKSLEITKTKKEIEEIIVKFQKQGGHNEI